VSKPPKANNQRRTTDDDTHDDPEIKKSIFRLSCLILNSESGGGSGGLSTSKMGDWGEGNEWGAASFSDGEDE